MDRDLANLFQHRLPCGGHPIVLGLQHTSLRAALDRRELTVNDLSSLVTFRPEVHTIDISVGEPKALLMWVVLRLSRYARDHRVAPGHNGSGSCAQWEEDRLIVTFKIVGRE